MRHAHLGSDNKQVCLSYYAIFSHPELCEVCQPSGRRLTRITRWSVAKISSWDIPHQAKQCHFPSMGKQDGPLGLVRNLWGGPSLASQGHLSYPHHMSDEASGEMQLGQA